METVRKINDELAIAGQLTCDDLKQIALEGFQSVLNLRSPTEEGFLTDEQPLAEVLGLAYMNAPLTADAIDDALANRVLQLIDYLPKPILIHCSSGMRAAAMALMHVATRQGMTLDRAFGQARRMGLFEHCSPQA